MKIYTLTALTRDSAQDRRAIVGGFDLPLHTLKVLGAAAVPGLVVAALAWAVVGFWGLFAGAAVVGGIWWLVESRDSTGLRTKRWRGLADQRRARSTLGVLVVCGEPVTSRHGRACVVKASSVAGRRSGADRHMPAIETLFGPKP